MTSWVRTAHRWLGLVLTAAVVLNLIALSLKVQSFWIGLLALAPLILMMVSGLWMVFSPRGRVAAR